MYKYVLSGVIACGCAVGVVAAPIDGSISFSDGGITVPGVPSTSIVSLLDVVTQSPGPANACSGDYAFGGDCDMSAPLTTGTIDLNAPAGVAYTYGSFAFDLVSVGGVNRVPLVVDSNGLGSDLLTFNLFGTATGVGFDPTPFLGIWTGNGACLGNVDECLSNLTASWSVSLAAKDTLSVGEPGTLALIGIALLGFGIVRQSMNGEKRRSA